MNTGFSHGGIINLMIIYFYEATCMLAIFSSICGMTVDFLKLHQIESTCNSNKEGKSPAKGWSQGPCTVQLKPMLVYNLSTPGRCVCVCVPLSYQMREAPVLCGLLSDVCKQKGKNRQVLKRIPG